MKTFIRVFELWIPDRTRTRLEFGGSLCGDVFSEFCALSESALFAYNEGLPGKAWAAGRPIVLTELSNSDFKRAGEAREAGLKCAIALPVFAGEFLMAVLVMFCGDDGMNIGAIELWHNDPEVSHELGLVDGYYGTAGAFEFNSRHTRFPRGYGLPGRAWKAGMPLIIKDLHNAKQFMRKEEASEIGITCGVGIPYKTAVEQTWVVTLLSAQSTPIAGRFEIWMPNEARSALVFDSGDCIKNTDLNAHFGSRTIGKGEGSIGGTWATGMPAIVENLAHEETVPATLALSSGLNQMVTLPVIVNATLKAVLAWYL